MTILGMLAALLPMAAVPAAAGTGPVVFINEIHYDNVSTDEGEAIEVAGPVGTDLTGWSLVPYNGNGGTQYSVTNLSGSLADQGGGYGTASFPISGLQNGAPDGVALVDAGNTVVQFLSYEGSFTATDGPASGMNSVDIGVSESSSTPVGDSLYLVGTGFSYDDFTWTSGAASFGEINPGQTFTGTVAEPSLLINEVDADQVGTDAAEFVELYDGGTGGTDLTGLSIVLFNGSDDASYAAFDLDGLSTNADGYFVLCGDAANVANCDLDVTPDTNLIQNGADAVALIAGDADDFPEDTPVTTVGLIDALVYDTDDSDDAGLLVLLNSGQPQVNERDGGDGTRDSNQRCPNGSGGARNTVTYAQFEPTPGESNLCEIIVPPLSCADPLTVTPIHDIQGSGASSPLVGQVVVVDAVVTGIFPGLSGFYLQEEPADQDTDPMTSEGVFIFGGVLPDEAAVGDLVRVQGDVAEFVTSGGASSLTEVNADGIAICEVQPEPIVPTELTLPVSPVSDLEAYEGMLVSFPQDLYISEYFNFDRFGEIILTTERQFQPTAIFDPGTPEVDQLAADNALGRITLDDGRSSQNPDPAIHPNGAVFDLTNTFRGGDIVNNVTGVIDDTFGLYRIQPTAGADYTAANPRTDAPEDVGGGIQVASFNVLNYFTTLGSRGADDAEEFSRQRDKIFAAIDAIDADVVGLIEIENNTEAILDLVSGLNEVAGAGTYDLIDTGVIGPDAIKVAFIYQPASVTPVGDYAVLEGDFLDPNNLGDDKNRPALAQTFMDNATGGVVTVVNNHLKSKGSACGDGDDDPVQGNCNLTRTLAAELLVEWLATDPTESGDEDFLIVGDLNAYDHEDPIMTIVAGADGIAGTDDDFGDLMLAYQGEEAYSYLFGGQLGYLDHALANQALLGEVTGTTAWHINSDEPDILDYDTTFKQDAQDALYEPNAFRSSDHDPVIVGLDICDEIAPTIDVSVTPDLLWPPNHRYTLVTATVEVSDNFDTDPTVTLLSVVSNELDDGLGDGDTPNDIRVLSDFTFALRAERSALGTGRIYTITYQVTDDCGNSAIGTAEVYVPLNRGRIR